VAGCNLAKFVETYLPLFPSLPFTFLSTVSLYPYCGPDVLFETRVAMKLADDDDDDDDDDTPSFTLQPRGDP